MMTPEHVAKEAAYKALEPLRDQLDADPKMRNLVAQALMVLSREAAAARRPRKRRLTRAWDELRRGIGLLRKSQTPWEKVREGSLRTGQNITEFIAELVNY